MIGAFFRKAWRLLNHNRFERELEEEMRAHREQMGEPVRFGNTLRMREHSRDQWGWNWLEDAVGDLSLGARALARTPPFTITSVLILSLGIGLNLALFQLINVTFLRPLAVKDPHTLVRLYAKSKRGTSSSVPYRVTQYVRANSDVLSTVLTEDTSDIAYEDNAADRLAVSYVSANWFTELGYGAARGRVLLEEIDERADAPPVVVISDDFWKTRLGGDPDVAGKTVRLNNRPVLVIGVARPDFPGLRMRKTQVWLPIRQMPYFQPGTELGKTWRDSNVEMYGRLRAGASPEIAKDSLQAAMRGLARDNPGEFDEDPWLQPLSGAMRFESESDRGDRNLATGLALGLTGLVLLVACSNLANLTLCRALGRMRELSVRAALGASRTRILRHLLSESVLLAVMGAAGGMAIGYAAARAMGAAAGLPAYLDYSPDARTSAAALAAALIAMIAVGVVPLWRISRCDLNSALKDGGQQASGSLDRTRLRSLLVGVQVAGSCMLVVMAGLLARGLQRVLLTHPGFSYRNVVVLDAGLPRYGIKSEEARQYWATVSRSLAAHPAVESVALTSLAPLGHMLNEGDYRDAPGLKVTHFEVEPEFFNLMRVRIDAGRNFSAADGETPVAIVSRRLAVEMYGTLDVIGRQFPKSGARPRTIVGLTTDAHLIKIGDTRVAEAFFPLRGNQYQDLVLLARARGNPTQLLAPMRQIARLGDERVLAEVRLMTADFERRTRPAQMVSTIAGAMALLSLGLAGLGIFGAMSWSAAVRRKEIGIRMALGAPGLSVAGIVLRGVARPSAIGAACGIAVSIPAGIALSKGLGFVQMDDLIAFALALVLLASAGVAASLIPAARALRTDALDALRQE